MNQAKCESSKLSRQRPPPFAQNINDTSMFPDRQDLRHKSLTDSGPDSSGKGAAKNKRNFLLGSPSIPQTLSPFSLAQARLLVPSKSSYPASTSHAAPFLPSTPNRAFARSISCSSYGAAAMQARDGKQPQSQQSLQHAKASRAVTSPLPLGNVSFIPQQAEDKLPLSFATKLPSSTRQLPSLQGAQRVKSFSEEGTGARPGSGIRPDYSLPPEVIRALGPWNTWPVPPDSSHSDRESAPSQSSEAGAASSLQSASSIQSGSCSLLSGNGYTPFQPAPPQEQPCAFRRKTILAATHHMRQPLHREFSPSQDSISDSGSREGVGVQQQQQGSRLQLRSGAPSLRGPPRLSGAASLVVPQSLSGPPSLSGEPSLSGAPSLSPQAPGAFATGEAFKRRGSAVPKQVTIAVEHGLDGTEAGAAMSIARRRSTGEENSRPGSSPAGAERQMEGEEEWPMSRRARWSCAGLVERDDSPLWQELSTCERERRQRLKASRLCEQLAQANALANPAAFCLNALEAEDAKRELAAEAAQLCLKKLEGGRSSSDKQVVDQFNTRVRLLRASRSFYHAPKAKKQQVARALLDQNPGPWTLERSLFQQRALDNDARNIFDTPEVLDAQFEHDWQRICQRGGLAQAIAAATVVPATQHGEAIDWQQEVTLQLAEVRRELRNHIHMIRSCFTFFAALAPTHRPHEFMAMRMQDFCEFTRCCNITDTRSPSCKLANMEAIFKASKGPAGPSGVQHHGISLEGMATHPHLLHRSEFMECIVHLALAKHFKATHTAEGKPSVAAAMVRLFEEDIEPNLSPTAKVDANAFRKDRLYKEEMELCIRSHWAFLRMAFKVYSAGGDVLTIEGWLALLAGGALLGRANHTGIDKHAAKVMFVLSQATVVDKLECPQSRAEGLTFYDFVEALARLSEVLCPPTPDELSSLFQSHPPTSQPLSVEASEFAWMTLMDDPNRKAGPAPTTSIADTEVTFTIPPLMGTSSDPCAGNNSGRGEASALLQLKGWSKLAFGGESPVPTLQNGSSSSSSSSNSSQAYPRVHIFFKSLLQWQQLCKYRMCEAGLDKALHAAARQRPLLDCFEPMMELFESGMRRTWSGQSNDDTISNMKTSLGLQGGA